MAKFTSDTNSEVSVNDLVDNRAAILQIFGQWFPYKISKWISLQNKWEWELQDTQLQILQNCTNCMENHIGEIKNSFCETERIMQDFVK